MCREMVKTNVKNKTVKDTQKHERRAHYGILISCFTLLLVGAIVAICCYFAYSPKGEGNSIGNFLAIFSLLITMIAIVLPLGSYFINKLEIHKITAEYEQRTAEQSKQFQKRMEALDNEYLEMFESIIKRHSISYSNTDNIYMKVGKDYLNALAYFSDGAYFDCETKLQTAVNVITTNAEYLLQIDEHSPLLIYKIFNLYRKLLGRIRKIDANMIDKLKFLITDKAIMNNAIAYRAVLFLYIKSQFDFVEKIPNFISEYLPLDEFIQLENEINKLNSDSWLHYTLLAKYRYVIAYFYRHEINANHKLALKYCQMAYVRICGMLSADDTTHEVLREIIKSCAFIIVKVFDQSYYIVADKKEQREYLLSSETILKRLIERQIDAKYYLELSNVLKKIASTYDIDSAEAAQYINESDKAAQYGYNLSPTDPLLAAQCAYVYLRKYLLKSTNDAYLIKARECIETADWIYSAEKERNKQKDKKYSGGNVRFSYIASLFATIETYSILADKSTSSLDGYQYNLEKIKNSIDNSIADDPNNVVNYRRAFLIYMELYSHANKIQDKSYSEKCWDELIVKIKEFKQNAAFNFSNEDLFYDFASAIKSIEDTGSNRDDILNKFKSLLTESAKCI